MSMMSILKLSAGGLETFKHFGDPNADIAFLTFSMQNNSIVVDEQVKTSQLKGILSSEEATNFKRLDGEPDVWACLRLILTKGERLPKYATVRVPFQVEGTDREVTKMVFVMWCPEDAPSKSQMMMSMAKNRLFQQLGGENFKVEASNDRDLDYFKIAEDIKRMIIEIW